MAVTSIGINDPIAVRTWSKLLNQEVSKAISIAPLIGKDSNSIIQLKDETNKANGDSISFGLRVQLYGDGVSEGQALEGKEEALQFLNDRLVINELSHAVRVKNEGTIDQQRILHNLRTEAKNGLVDWYADRLSMMFFIQVCGYTAKTINFEGRTITLKPVHYGFNPPTEPTAKRILRPGERKKDSDLKAEDVFTFKLIDKAVERAKLANPKIRPVRVNGENVYVLYLHPTQVTQLRTNTQPGQWLDITKAIYSGSRMKNPIYNGSLGMYNGVILREAEHVTEGVNAGSGDDSNDTAVPNVRRAVLLGAQSAVIAFGKDRGATRYKLVEELFDYEREFGVAAKTIIGMKKTCFQLPSKDVQSAQDFGTIVISTYGAPS
ncbi:MULTISPECIES: N4-gp56 family major capsid protein [unclassified Bartonella]|uniref:N4-gp56 family major capsid protein n=1 Tax=unclassified Bartonella TaxID=2645622 RepID=UPI0009996AA7|nr:MULTISPECIES: N4-gp56 family major capsid protein [unclassified Bartonella]AQX28411.1 major capsid protein, N4-gp56 family [Bartonella sp. JB15]AQX29678.1 major capsid protein, N4-gp56 family [Bartonella sp. JB63]